MGQRNVRRRRLALGLLAGLAVLLVAGRAVLPVMLARHLESEASSRLGVPVSIDDIDLHLVHRRAVLAGITIGNPAPYDEDAPALRIERVELARSHTRDEPDPAVVYDIQVRGAAALLCRRDGHPSNLELLREALGRQDSPSGGKKDDDPGRQRNTAEDDGPGTVTQVGWEDLEVGITLEGGRRAGTVRLASDGGLLLLGAEREPKRVLLHATTVVLERGSGTEPLLDIEGVHAEGEPGGRLDITIEGPVVHLDHDADLRTSLRHARRVVGEVLGDSAEEAEDAGSPAAPTEGGRVAPDANEARDGHPKDSVPVSRLVLSGLEVRLSFLRDGVRREVPLGPADATVESSEDGGFTATLEPAGAETGGIVALELRTTTGADGLSSGTMAAELRGFPFHLLAWRDEPAKDDGESARVQSALLDGRLAAEWSGGGFHGTTELRFHDVEARRDGRPLHRRLLAWRDDPTSNWGTLLSDLGTGTVRFGLDEDEGSPSPFFLWSRWRTALHEAMVEAGGGSEHP